MKKLLFYSFLLLLFFGCTAPQGDVGPKGLTGATGVPGTNGTNGPTGAKGPTGDNGLIGAVGPAGAQGNLGQYTGYTTGWKTLTWQLGSDITTSGARKLTFESNVVDSKITDIMLKQSYYELYLYSSKVYPLLLAHIDLNYRKIGTKYYNVNTSPSAGNLKFIITSTFASDTDNTKAIVDSLNADNIKINFSTIYK